MTSTKPTKFLMGSTGAAQHRELRAAIAAAEAERETHAARRGPAVRAELAGDPGAGQRRAAIDAEIARLDARLRDLRDAAADAERVAGEEAEAERAREAQENVRRKARLADEHGRRAERAAMYLRSAAEELRHLVGGNPEAPRVFDGHSARLMHPHLILERIKAGVASIFVQDRGGAQSANNNLLGLENRGVGEAAWREFDEIEWKILDDVIGVYPTEEAAEAAQARWKRRGEARVVEQVGEGIWRVSAARRSREAA